MPIVSSFGTLKTYAPGGVQVTGLTTGTGFALPASSWLTDVDHYALLYRTQPAVRTCVDFLARNMAQLGFHVFRRVSDTDRERLADHELVRMLASPNPGTTRYRLFEAMMQDLCIYGRAYWLKVRGAGPLGLVRLPPFSVAVGGWLIPNQFQWTLPDGTVRALEPVDVAYFSMYDPETLDPLAPLETLRVRLEEETAAVDFRAGYWRNAARLEGVVERPLAAPKWTRDQKDSWREQWVTRFGNQPGQTAVLEDGMTWKSITQSWQESEYMAARKFAREEVASLYHIPLPMVGILEHATFCLPGDVEVFTEEGPRAIREIRAGDRVWSLTAPGTWTLSAVARSACTGDDEILTLRTANRTLRLNARHRVLARRAVWAPAPVAVMTDGHRRAVGRAQKQWITDYVAAGDLRVGDTMVVLKHLPAADEASVRLPSGRVATLGFLEICGLVLGDGNVTRVKGDPVGLQIARMEGAPYMDAYRATLGDLVAADRLPDTRGPLHLIEGGRQTRLMSVAVGREFDRLGFSGTARTKRVPGWVFGLPEAYRLALLRGFLDADGSCDKRGRLSFSSCSRPLLSQIRHLCLSVGVPVTNLREQRGQTRLPTGRLAAFSQWSFTCSDPGANRRIGSHTPEYQRRLAAGQPFDRKGSRYPWQGGRGFASETTQLSAIVQIDRQRIHEPVYDLEVDGTHSFIADGVVVHNSNIVEQHKQLYQDCLGPHCEHIKLEIERQLLPECADTDRVYSEFNIADKLAGSFEEQSTGLFRLVGRPIMTANEGRARLNLPAIQDDPTADALALPLNQSTGGLAPVPVAADRALAAAALAPVLEATFARQWMRLEKLPPDLRVHAFDIGRWDRELADDLRPLVGDEAETLAERINTDTLRRLVDGVANPFEGRGADAYV